MKKDQIKKLIELANALDEKGMSKVADEIDKVVRGRGELDERFTKPDYYEKYMLERDKATVSLQWNGVTFDSLDVDNGSKLGVLVEELAEKIIDSEHDFKDVEKSETIKDQKITINIDGKEEDEFKIKNSDRIMHAIMAGIKRLMRFFEEEFKSTTEYERRTFKTE